MEVITMLNPDSHCYYLVKCAAQMLNISANQKQFVLQLLQKNLRLDGRQHLIPRISFAQFLDQPGCLLYHQGDTIVLIKTNIKIVEPRSERPSEGFVTFKVDCHCCCDNFESNKKLSIEISKLLQTIVVGSHALDLESLCIVSGKYVWSLQIDSIVVVDDGNVLDAILNGNVLALMDMRKPYIAVSQVKVIEKNTQIEMNNEKLQYLSLAHIPVSMSFGLIPQNIFADPIYLEQRISLSKITITMNIYKQLCAVHKTGGMGITQSIMTSIIRVLQKTVKETTDNFRRIIKQRKLASDF